MNKVSRLSDFFIIIYFTISLGVALQIGGTNWDIIWHGVNDIDSFLTPPHIVLYSGVLLVIILNILGIYFWYNDQAVSLKINNNQIFSLKFKNIPAGLKLSIIGSLFEISSGFFDSWWHSNFGFDGLLSPPHLIIGTGMLISIIGVFVGINHYKIMYPLQTQKKIFKITSTITYAVLWMVSINITFMFTLPYSEGQFFNFNPDSLLAIITSVIITPVITIGIFLHALKTLESRFIFSSITGSFMIIQIASTIVSNEYFTSLLPFYILNILPALVCDFIVNYNKKRYCSNKYVKKKLHNGNIVLFIIMPIFLVTLYFPWTVNIYKIYYEIEDDTFESIHTFNELLPIFILPILIPATILVSLIILIAFNQLSSKTYSKTLANNKQI